MSEQLTQNQMRILVVEDQKKMAAHLRKALREGGHAVDEAHNGDDALILATNEPYDAIVLDIMLPGRDGLSVLRTLRQRNVSTPVLILSARGETSERIEGLNIGADDYMTKPFSMEELVARVNALLRRAAGERAHLLKVGDLSMNLVSREVLRAGRKAELTMREFGLLEYLMRSAGRVVTRTQILEHVWGYHFDPGTNVVEVYIQRVRKKMDEGFDPKLIRTVFGHGYKLSAE